jgi:Animal haem peroxidase/TAT (twin-arginine translocation) pathway signal sequence
MGENRADDFSRRSFLKGTAAVSLGTAVGATSLGTAISAAWMAPAAAAEPAPMPPHGAELRGMDLVTKSPTTEGRFGFMFKSQPPHPASNELLDRLGATMAEQPDVGGTSALNNENDTWNENPNPKLTSGFTFVGQFVDHDITFDTTTLSDQESDPDATTNFRTPRYDLDAIYGRGPNTDPQFYNLSDPDKFQIEERPYDQITGLVTSPTTPSDKVWDVKPDVVWDVPRNADGTAKIADPRNDQTLIILQLHVAMLRFHNRLVDVLRMQGVPRSAVFESARRLARWHYQWIVTHEFLPAIAGTTITNSVYQETSRAPRITLKFYKPTNPAGRSFIPVEFAVAAYRFGHSITRPRYTVQDVFDSAGTKLGSVSAVPLFEEQPTDNNLNGHRKLPARLKIQWSKFFNADSTKPTARPVRQFDASLAAPLANMPTTALPDANTLGKLAQRNLQRGRKMGLPSGQQVARLMGVTPLTSSQLWTDRSIKVRIPIASSNVVEPLSVEEVENQSLKTLFADPGWRDEAPLWFYILKEAEIVGKGQELGPVGGRIVAEVLVGLLQKDPNSYLYLNPGWKPAPPIAPTSGKFTMADLLKFAKVWS